MLAASVLVIIKIFATQLDCHLVLFKQKLQVSQQVRDHKFKMPTQSSNATMPIHVLAQKKILTSSIADQDKSLTLPNTVGPSPPRSLAKTMIARSKKNAVPTLTPQIPVWSKKSPQGDCIENYATSIG